MYKGMFLKRTTIPEKIKEALWWEEQCVRREGGYDFDPSNLPDDAKWLPKGTVLKFVKETGKACVVKSTRVKENASKSATTLKIEKDSYFKVGDTIAGVTISNIVKGSDYDTLTIGALTDALKVGDTVDDYKDGDIILGLQYDTFPIEREFNQQVTPTLVVREVVESSLMYPISDKVKAALNKVGTAQFKIQ